MELVQKLDWVLAHKWVSAMVMVSANVTANQ
jgi:hypothetical protein